MPLSNVPQSIPISSNTCCPLPEAMKEYERQRLVQALEQAGGHRTRAAELLGISRKNLWQKLRAHGMIDDGSAE